MISIIFTKDSNNNQQLSANSSYENNILYFTENCWDFELKFAIDNCFRLISIFMDIFRVIAEKMIFEAIERGEFDNLSGAGSPLKLEDETFVPEDLRMAYKVLKNSGFLPPELEMKKEIVNMQDMINSLDDDKERLKKIRELNFKIMKFNMMRNRPFNFEDFPLYEEKLIQKTIEKSEKKFKD